MDTIVELLERRGPSGTDTPPHAPEDVCPALEDRYQAAKARLLAAQQEKTEAAVEFLALRAALGRRLERLWPGAGEGTAQGAWFDAEMAAGV